MNRARTAFVWTLWVSLLPAGCDAPPADGRWATRRSGLDAAPEHRVTRPRMAEPARLQRVVLPAQRDIPGQAELQEGLLPDATYSHHGTDVWQCQPDANYEGDAMWLLGRNDGGGWDPCFGWPYLRFDLSAAVPADATVVQAVLSMYLYEGYGDDQTAASHRVLGDWDEASLTYNSMPPDWSNGLYESQVLLTGLGWWDWDITQMATDWVADPQSNHGLAVQPIDALADGEFVLWRSDDAATASQRPRLTVDFLLPEYRSAFVEQQPPPAAMFIGQSLDVELVFRNDGYDTWEPAAGYRLGSQSPPDNTSWGPSRVELDGPVAPGAQARFRFTITAPDVPGDYAFQWQLLCAGQGWFGESSPRLDIEVTRKPLAETCQSNGECQSGMCVDGYCCDGFCSGTCQSCALPGLEGTCQHIPAGADPDEECPGSGPCGATCDGAGACAYPPAGTDCASCASCDGDGNCNQYAAAGSDPGGQCGLCRICPGDGPDCVPAAAGSDPQGECQASPPASCGLTGDCDGAGACAFHPADTVCDPERCADAVHHPADVCDGAGACVDSGSQPCRPYVCLDAEVCRSDCSDDAHCSGDSYCEAGACAAYLNTGEPCAQDQECLSGHCVDGVCCDSACDDSCEVCDLPASPGSCLPVPDGQDPRDDCAGDGLCGGVCDGWRACRFPPADLACDTCMHCDGAGACADPLPAGSDPHGDCEPCWACSGVDDSCQPVAAGADPLDACPATPASECGTTGACDGAGGCALWPADTVCQPASCSDGLLAPADLCDGQGHCFDRGTLECAPYTCAAADACHTACDSDAECQAGFHCQQSACTADRPLGQACVRPGQCTSGQCVDGVCCDSACDGLCQRCDLAATLGSCSPLPAGADPDDECAGTGACGGACDGAGACALPGEETACGPCARCDGQGGCSVLVAAGQDPFDACGSCGVCAGDRDACVPVAAGADPLDDCAAEPVASCGQDGWCDGQGNCRLWPAGTLCGEQSCAAGVLQRAPACDGLGACLEQGSLACAPWGCDGDHCAGPPSLVAVSIEDAAEGGQPVGERQLTTDDELRVHAVGRDQNGNALGTVVVRWSVSGDIGTIPAGPASAAVLDPTRPGAGRIAADFYLPEVQDGETGDLLVGPGLPSGRFEMHPEPRLLPADGQARSQISAGPLRDADGNPVAAGHALTVIASAGRLLAEDADPAAPGLQRLTGPAGTFAFALQAEAAPAAARLRAEAAAPADALGEAWVYFGDGRPVAVAGADQTVSAGSSVTLDGSASYDPEQQPLGYRWSQLAGPQVALANAAAARTSFTAPLVAEDQQLRFELVVTAGERTSQPDAVAVTVLAGDGDRPTAQLAVEPQAGPAPLAVALDGSASSAAPCCTLAGYLWRFDDGSPSGSGPRLGHEFSQPGGWGVELTVVDDAGHFDQARVLVAVADGANSPPSLTVSAEPDRGRAPLQVAFSALAADADGAVERIEWDFGAGYRLTGPDQQHLFAEPGMHRVRVRAVDDAGLASVQTIHIPVADAAGVHPPRILSQPELQAEPGRVWRYSPLAAGSAPLAWELGKQVAGQQTRRPAGMQIEADNGQLTWTPAAEQTGPQAVTLVVRNAAGVDFQDFTVEVAPAAEGGAGCGCASGAPAGRAWPWLLWALGALLAWSRRRPR